MINNPFRETSAAHDPNDYATASVAGGRCYPFTDDLGDVIPTSASIGDSLATQQFTCPGDEGFPPVIHNPVLDHPWTPPPPVTTGCYPLRARAHTIYNDAAPEAITASFADQAGVDKCFPILDIVLNTHPVIDQVLNIIAPGGGGGTLYNPLGCCCDEFGAFFPAEEGKNFPSAGTGGTIGDCVGQRQPDDYPNIGNIGGVGVSWDNEDPTCDACMLDNTCCCSYANNKFSSLHPVGIGIITDAWDEDTLLGEVYNLDVYLSKAAGLQPGGGDDTLAIKAHNLAEIGVSGAECGICSDERYVPGITGAAQNVYYPGAHKPQRICPGASVVVFGIKESSATDYISVTNSDCTTTTAAPFGACFPSADPLLFFFTFENAHDSVCLPDLPDP